MATIKVITTAGLARQAAAMRGGPAVVIDSIRVGSVGFATTEAQALALTALVGATLKTQADPAGVSEGSVVQFTYNDPSADTYNVTEIGLFDGTDLIAYACDDAGAALISKSAVTAGLIGVTVNFTNATFTGTFSTPVQLPPTATAAQPGVVRLASNSDTTSTGAVVLSPAQIQARIAAAGVSVERVQDIVGAMVSGNVETNIAVAYSDTTGKLNFSVTLPEAADEGETEAGTLSSKFVSPLRLRGAEYRRVLIQTGNTRPTGIRSGDLVATVETS